VGKHVAGTDEAIILLRTTSWGLYVCAFVWIAYLALEPWVRRQWPHSIISWTRLLAGRVRDSRVGADLLAGICFGVLSKWIDEGCTALLVGAGGQPDQTSALALLGGRFALAPWTNALSGSIVTTLGLFMLFFLCRLLARKFWLACILFVFIFVGISALSSHHLVYDVSDALLVFTLFTFVMIRYGLVTFAAMSLINSVLGQYALTWDFSAFYASSSLFALLSVVVAAGFAFHYSLGGRAIFGDDVT
jgi:serine/threonine-protein kinase